MSAYFTVDDKRRIVLVTGERDDFGEPVETQRTLELQEAILLKQQLAIATAHARAKPPDVGDPVRDRRPRGAGRPHVQSVRMEGLLHRPAAARARAGLRRSAGTHQPVQRRGNGRLDRVDDLVRRRAGDCAVVLGDRGGSGRRSRPAGRRVRAA